MLIPAKVRKRWVITIGRAATPGVGVLVAVGVVVAVGARVLDGEAVPVADGGTLYVADAVGVDGPVAVGSTAIGVCVAVVVAGGLGGAE
jgi:hypothetical protein